MCYAAPGPRCSGHAKKTLQKAFFAYNEDPSEEAWKKLSDAYDEFDSTPAGFAALEKKIDSVIEPSTAWALQDRLDLGRARRDEALAAIKTTDSGDIGTDLHASEEAEEMPELDYANFASPRNPDFLKFEYDRLQTAFKKKPTENNRHNLQDVEGEYDSTLQGLEDLKEQHTKAKTDSKRQMLQRRMYVGKARRDIVRKDSKVI